MTAKALIHINIRAPSLMVEALKDFYQGVLGLTPGWRPPFKSKGHWLYLGDVPVIHLVEDEAVGPATGRRGAIVDHVSFSCSDLPAFEGLLSTKAIPFRRSTVPSTRLVQLLLVDPAGNGVELQFDEGDA